MLCEGYAFPAPFGCGYKVEMQYPEDEEMALRVLSQDNDYDLCYLSSRSSISVNIRDKGSFYPLNDVKGVSEYLDKCFPYLKDAAVNQYGDIWMIPVSMDMLTLFYNEQNSGDLSQLDLAEYIGYVGSMNDRGLQEKYGNSAYILTEALFMQYLLYNNSFDTPEFRQAAELLKTAMNHTDGRYINPFGSDAAVLELMSGKTDNFYSNMSLYRQFMRYMSTPGLKAVRPPCVIPSDKSMANLIFMCVNPASKNLEAATDYISSLVQYIQTQQNTCLLADKSTYSDTDTAMSMYSVAENAEVGFAYPVEIYWGAFEDYLSGGITLDEFIAEADRKLSAYLNE